MPRSLQIRSVNGWGPRCGCGGESIVHFAHGYEVTTATSTFLCRDCGAMALAMFQGAYDDQPPYWPGDEGRDEHYIDPRSEAA